MSANTPWMVKASLVWVWSTVVIDGYGAVSSVSAWYSRLDFWTVVCCDHSTGFLNCCKLCRYSHGTWFLSTGKWKAMYSMVSNALCTHLLNVGSMTRMCYLRGLLFSIVSIQLAHFSVKFCKLAVCDNANDSGICLFITICPDDASSLLVVKLCTSLE